MADQPDDDPDDLDDDGPEFRERDLETRHAMGLARLTPWAEMLGGTLTLESDDEVTTVAEQVAYERAARDDGDEPDEGLYMSIRAQVPESQRGLHVRLVLRRDPHVTGETASDVRVGVQVDNRVGRMSLEYDDEDDVDTEQYTHVVRSLYASEYDSDARASTVRMLARIPGFAEAVDDMLRVYEDHWCQVADTIALPYFADIEDDEEGWGACTQKLPRIIESLDKLAAMIERVPPPSFVTCRYCDGRYMPGADAKCPHCGGAL